MGWSWSPDSNTLVYSDGGKLTAYTLQGPGLVFPATQDSRIDPFWLPNGNLLYLQLTNGVDKLAIVDAQKGH
jgi:WD40-like Beta Propeller Repeat